MAFSSLTTRVHLVLLLALPACTVRDPGDSDSDSSTAASTSTAGTTDAPTTGTPTTVPPGDTGDVTLGDTGETGVVTSDTSATSDGTSTGGDLHCPPEDPANFHFELDPAPDDFADILFDWDCDVLDAITTPDGATISLDCTADGMKVDPPPRVLFTAVPPPPTIGITAGQSVHVRYEQAAPWWTERSLRIDAGDTILFAGDSGSGIVDAFAGVGLEPLEPACPPQGDDFCGPVQHDGLRVTLGDASGDVQSRTFTAFGAYGVWAPELTHFVDEPRCTDTPNHWRALDLLRLIP